MFDKVLIANRGEIALRIQRACRGLGLKTVVVYSEADRHAQYVTQADEALCIGPAAPTQSYLNQTALLFAAQVSGAQAIHPGYGFLSENAAFAERIEAAGLTFIGPSAECIRTMGDKVAAKRAMREAGVPCVPGPDSSMSSDPQAILAVAGEIGYPVIVKAAGGGGGRGMRVVQQEAELLDAIALTREEARLAFGNPELYIEKFLGHPRHVEIQVLCDAFGHAVWLGSRDCSLQRRHQKVLEEAPAPGIDPQLIAHVGERCVKACQQIGYRGVGTFEFLYEDGQFFFIEMNTRLQVEHPVTEAITGLDLVAWQIRVARGEALLMTQDQVPLIGHAIEVRLYAEDPSHDFLPATGRLALYRESTEGPGRRVDSGVEEGDEISPFYDPMLGKLIAWGEDREQARLRLLSMLDEFAIGGLKTNINFLRRIIGHPAFAAAELDTGFIPRHQEQLLPEPAQLSDEFWQAAAQAFAQSQPNTPRADDPSSPWAINNGLRAGLPTEITLHLSCEGQDRALTLGDADAHTAQLKGEYLLTEHNGLRRQQRAIRRGDTLYLQWDGELRRIESYDPIGAVEASHSHQGGLTAPMNGSIVRVLVEAGQTVEAGAQLVVLEAMKMEHSIRAPHAGIIKALYCQEGEMVSEGSALVELEQA
jgi:3-methylcrotonyl-CoA carboxylase alpha subunit